MHEIIYTLLIIIHTLLTFLSVYLISTFVLKFHSEYLIMFNHFGIMLLLPSTFKVISFFCFFVSSRNYSCSHQVGENINILLLFSKFEP